MAEILLATQVPPAAPGANDAYIWIDSVTKKLCTRDDTGKIDTIDDVLGSSVADQVGFAADTYLVGASIPLQSIVPKVGLLYQCSFDVVKTAAGVVAPVLTFRFGALGTVADPAILVFNQFPAQTAVIDEGRFEVSVLFRTIGAAGTVAGRAHLSHGLSITGLSTLVSKTAVPAVSAGFNTALANAILGLSVNGGAAAAFTIRLVESSLINA